MKVLVAINPAHKLTSEQVAELAGHSVTRIEEVDSEFAQFLSNMTDENVMDGYWKAAARMSRLADSYDAVVLPIGNPAFQFRFGLELGLNNDPQCLDKYFFSHSIREAQEKEVDGKVQKVSAFRHVRFFNLRGNSFS